MNVSLTPELEHLVAEKVASGMYQTSSEVIREGLRLLKEQDENREALRRDIRVGMDGVQRGSFIDFEPTKVHELATQVKARGRRRLASAAKRK